MASWLLSKLCLSWLLLLLTTCVSATWLKTPPRLGAHRMTLMRNLNIEAKVHHESYSNKDFKTFYYKQTLDHFNYRPNSYTIFKQRFVINSKYWGGANTSSPIFVYLGEETSLDDDLSVIGIFDDHAPRFNALIVFIEHRYYGKSIPFGSKKEAFRNASTLGYFNSAQALADYAGVIVNLKKKLSAETCPVIVYGASYGGMLASWFRLKYPHVAIGALASSAPILYFEDIKIKEGYYTIVTKDFRDASKSCYNTIRRSWSIIDKIAHQANGLSALSRKFKTCSPLNTSSELKNFLDDIYADSAQHNNPPVKIVCDAIDEAPNGTHILSRIFAGVFAVYGKQSCYDTKQYLHPSETTVGWRWQTCTDMVIPIGYEHTATMFQFSPFDMHDFIASCRRQFGVAPRPHWIVTEFGGNDIKLVLKKFGSNIIFSNGLRDPYSVGGVLHNISNSIVAITTTEGAHCLDILKASSDDPEWLLRQRASEIKIIDGWIKAYNVMRSTIT